MIEIWGLDGTLAAEAAEKRAVNAGKALLNGPALPGQGLDQADVDIVMGPAPVSRNEEDAPPIEFEEVAPIRFEEAAVAHAPARDAVIEMPVNAEPLAIVDDEIEEAQTVVIDAPQPKSRAASASDPLESFMALSADEKIAVFT